MPVTDARPEWLREYDDRDQSTAPSPPICPTHGPRPVAAGLPDHPGYSGWGRVQCLDGSWLPCIRCGDCGSVLLVDKPLAPSPSSETRQIPHPDGGGIGYDARDVW